MCIIILVDYQPILFQTSCPATCVWKVPDLSVHIPFLVEYLGSQKFVKPFCQIVSSVCLLFWFFVSVTVHLRLWTITLLLFSFHRLPATSFSIRPLLWCNAIFFTCVCSVLNQSILLFSFPSFPTLASYPHPQCITNPNVTRLEDYFSDIQSLSCTRCHLCQFWFHSRSSYRTRSILDIIQCSFTIHVPHSFDHLPSLSVCPLHLPLRTLSTWLLYLFFLFFLSLSLSPKLRGAPSQFVKTCSFPALN